MAITVIHNGKRIHGIVILGFVNDVDALTLFQNGDFDTIVKVQGVLCVGVPANMITITGREVF